MRAFLAKYRAPLVLVGFAGLFVAVTLSGAFDGVTPEQIRDEIRGAGAWGMLLFVVAFAVGELLHIPGMVFVVAGVLTYGRVNGFLVGLAGAVVSVTVSFVLVRALGGQGLTKLKWKWVAKALDQLDARPFRTVALLRLVLWVAPPLNFALAMSRVRLRDYVLGSAAGLVLPVLFVTLLFEQAMAWVGG